VLYLGPLAKRAPWQGPSPVAFVDTNVMNEYMAVTDLARAIDLAVEFNVDAEPRRLRARGTLWMAMALDQLGVATVCLEDEVLPLVLRQAGDDDLRHAWLTLTKRFIHPVICNGWTLLNLDATVGGHDRNDTIVAEQGAARGIPVITRDPGVVRKTKARGGTVMTPEAFAARVLSIDDARSRFFERFDKSAPGWAFSIGLDGLVDRSRTRSQCEGLKWSRVRLDYIWTDSPQSFSLHTHKGEIELGRVPRQPRRVR
jgi:hypothetical protein